MLQVIGNEKYSTKELMELLHLKSKNNFIKNYLHIAFKDDLVALLYPANSKHRGQKYYLTEKGKKIINQSRNNE
jgi:hypothetical protein